jgi:hypothetical protein
VLQIGSYLPAQTYGNSYFEKENHDFVRKLRKYYKHITNLGQPGIVNRKKPGDPRETHI